MQILKPLVEHFRSVLNQSYTITDAVIDRLSEVDANADLDLLPSLRETIRAVQQLSSGKAPGSDALPADIYKHGTPTDEPAHNALQGDVAPKAGPSGFKGRHNSPPAETTATVLERLPCQSVLDEVHSVYRADLQLLQKSLQRVLVASQLTPGSTRTRGDISVKQSFG
ncbi:unnamed protein product [Schistocephalus solidus]|uniref:CEP44 domain-containing protein n=1 Tax=Schistocephalus solidus TaxID=70667 RepID=A0A183T778_SCHSO|nr:unnamed protein product [Schistocephalus solidus]